MRTVVGGTRRAAPPQIQTRLDLRHYFATNQWEASWAGRHVQPRPRCSPVSFGFIGLWIWPCYIVTHTHTDYICICVRAGTLHTTLLSLSKLPQGKFLHRDSPTSDLTHTQVARHQQERPHMTVNEMRCVFHKLATRVPKYNWVNC